MSHFRKMLFALVATASFFGMSSNANAQSSPFVCNTSFSPLVVRVEGLRELVGDIVISCTGGTAVGSNTGVSPNPVLASSNPVTPASNVIIPGTQTGVTAGGVPVISPNLITSNGSIIPPTVPAINISVTVSAGRITNRIFSSTSGLTDALLFIDEPNNPNPYSVGYSLANRPQNPCTSTTTTPGVCTGLNYFFIGGVAVAAGPGTTPLAISGTSNAPANTVLNIFQGQYGVGGGFVANERTITFVGVPVVQPGPDGGTRIYRIKNIRVQVANVFQINSQIQAFISIQNPPANLVLNNAQGIVGFVQQGLVFDAVGGGPFAQCLGLNQVSSTGTLGVTASIRFTEAYGVAFKRRGVGGPLDRNDPIFNPFYIDSFGQANPGVNYNTESGFYNLAFPTTNSLNLAGQAATGTRLRARFSDIPTNVSVFVSLAPVTGVIGSVQASGGPFSTTTNIGQGTTAPGSAYAVAGTDANGATGTPFAPVTSTSFATIGTGGTLVQGSAAPGFGGSGVAYSLPSGMVTGGIVFGQVAIASDGSGTYVWEVLRADDNIIDQFVFAVAFRFAPTTTIVTDITAVQSFVSGNLAPISAADPTILNNALIPSFVLSPEDRRAINLIGNCATNLLYPFVSSVTGFNTGMAIANTSKDPFRTAPEAGICLINFYGDAANGAIDPPQQRLSRALPSGKVAAFNLLFGNADWGITPVASFQGYIIVQCNFRWAHGFAFISDPSNLQTAQGYLALILDPNGLGGSQLRRLTGAPVAEQLDN